jgi:nucleoside-diphosphate-sugar epimerase
MHILLTGGAGDLATVLTPALEARGHTPLQLDVVAPRDPRGVALVGSVLDRPGLRRAMESVDCVIHIAAWHGIHDATKQRDVYAFWDLNVTGTFNVFEAAARAGVAKCIYISSTSVRSRDSVYGHTKVLGEEIARTYAARHAMQVIMLRPRGFIPPWNRSVYASFVEWAQWFWRGAVHIDDVVQAVLRSLDVLQAHLLEAPLTLVVDGAYEYTDDDLAHWDADGPGSTFRKYYAPYEALARQHGLQPEERPFKYDISEAQQWLGYAPGYGLRHLLEELARYGPDGPPSPL